MANQGNGGSVRADPVTSAERAIHPADNHDIRTLLRSLSCSSSIKTSRNCNRNVDFSLKRLEEFQRVLPDHLLIDPNMGGNDIDTERFKCPGTGPQDPGH